MGSSSRVSPRDQHLSSQTSINSGSYSAFRNNPTLNSSIHPEDANSMALYFNATSSASRASNISSYLRTNWGPIGAITPELPSNIVPFIESFEVKGHFAIRQTQLALDLIRLSWGWYLENPYGTGSSCIEGYYADGSFRYANDGYDDAGSYPSHAHGWSTGPTDALTSFLLGLTVTAPGGSQWLLAPQFGDLKSVEGGFTAGLGKFSAGWNLTDEGYVLWYDVPRNSMGEVVLPCTTLNVSIVLDEGEVGCGAFNAMSGLTTFDQASGGQHTITVSY